LGEVEDRSSRAGGDGESLAALVKSTAAAAVTRAREKEREKEKRKKSARVLSTN
jgi:hypothetical protein